MQHFLTIADATRPELDHVFDVAFALRQARQEGASNRTMLAEKTLAMLFEKPSLRTRVSFEQAMLELGGQAIVMGAETGLIGERESIGDMMRVLSGYVHGVAARVFEHEKLEAMRGSSALPVVNMLSDSAHPCQALADLMTMMDEFDPEGRALSDRTLAFIGDGNNVARSLAVLCGRLGVRFVLASPPGYAFEQAFVDQLQTEAPQMRLEVTEDPRRAVAEADAIYTDTFVSMGQEGETEARLRTFREYQVNDELLAGAPDHAIVLHCLPAHRGVEITDAVMDGPRSRVFAQAHNRLHAQKGLLAVLLGGA